MKIKVLYIDDEQNNLIGFKATFRLDYNIVIASTLGQALDVLSNENDVAVIICDQRMPGKTGIQALEEIKKKFPEPVRMLITGYTDIDAVIDAVNRGNIFRYIKKPWTDNDIRYAIDEALKYYFVRSFELDSIFLEKNGYIIWDLANDKRSVFVDLLKGFEEYAKLKGYGVTFSADSSIPNKIAFKFTLSDQINENENVRKDVLEYIEKIKDGGMFDDMPIILSREEHLLISTTLKNRLSFLYHNLELHRNGIDFYKQIIKELPQNMSMKTPSFIINNGNNNSRKLTATNSTNILQGEDILYENNSDNSIRIINSFNKIKEQLSKLDEVIQLLREEKEIIDDVKQSLITNFDKIREEIGEEEQPEKSKIFKWLSNTKKIAETIALSHKTAQAIKWIYGSFNFISHAMG